MIEQARADRASKEDTGMAGTETPSTAWSEAQVWHVLSRDGAVREPLKARVSVVGAAAWI